MLSRTMSFVTWWFVYVPWCSWYSRLQFQFLVVRLSDSKYGALPGSTSSQLPCSVLVLTSGLAHLLIWNIPSCASSSQIKIVHEITMNSDLALHQAMAGVSTWCCGGYILSTTLPWQASAQQLAPDGDPKGYDFAVDSLSVSSSPWPDDKLWRRGEAGVFFRTFVPETSTSSWYQISGLLLKAGAVNAPAHRGTENWMGIGFVGDHRLLDVSLAMLESVNVKPPWTARAPGTASFPSMGDFSMEPRDHHSPFLTCSFTIASIIILIVVIIPSLSICQPLLTITATMIILMVAIISLFLRVTNQLNDQPWLPPWITRWRYQDQPVCSSMYHVWSCLITFDCVLFMVDWLSVVDM